MVFIELLEKFVSVDVGGWFPAVVRFGETFPADKVLQLLSVTSDLEYSIHLPLRLPLDKIGSGFLVFVAI